MEKNEQELLRDGYEQGSKHSKRFSTYVGLVGGFCMLGYYTAKTILYKDDLGGASLGDASVQSFLLGYYGVSMVYNIFSSNTTEKELTSKKEIARLERKFSSLEDNPNP